MSEPSHDQKLQKNLSLYTRFRVVSNFLPWLSVFYLFFIERVSVSDAITLGAIYYLAVVVCEVPSGYFSDRFGRRPTLLLSSLFFLLAYVSYIIANNFEWLIVGQVFLASGIAFKSGSDTSLLFDSLKLLDRDAEYGDREAKAEQYCLIALAVSCFAGGLVGMIDLRLSYLLAVFAAFYTIYLCYKFTEPSQTNVGIEVGDANFIHQLHSVFSYMTQPVLAWIFVFYVIGYALQHVPYEFYQPYIKLLDVNQLFSFLQSDSAPMTSGIVMAISMFGGAVGASMSMRIYRSIGLVNTLMTGVAVIGIIIIGMATVLHPAMLLLVMLRNLPMSLVHAPMMAAIGPRVASSHRATYLSVQSLFGRLSFSLMLFTLAAVSGEQVLDWALLSQILRISAVVAVVGILVLLISSRYLLKNVSEADLAVQHPV